MAMTTIVTEQQSLNQVSLNHSIESNFQGLFNALNHIEIELERFFLVKELEQGFASDISWAF